MRRMAEVFYFPTIPHDRLVCSACGVEAKAACACGVDYVSKTDCATEAIKKNPQLSNCAIADQLGMDEGTVRRARKKLYSEHSEYARDTIMRRDGRVRIATTKRPAKPPGKLYKAPKTRSRYKAPVTEKDQLIAFTRELSQFVMHFTLELAKWLDTNPEMEPEGRDALAHTLEAYSMQLQQLAQRIDGR